MAKRRAASLDDDHAGGGRLKMKSGGILIARLGILHGAPECEHCGKADEEQEGEGGEDHGGMGFRFA